METEPMNDTNLSHDTSSEAENTNLESEKDQIFIDLFAAIMTSKINHSIPNSGIDEILQAFKIASKKSTALLKKMVHEVMENQESK